MNYTVFSCAAKKSCVGGRPMGGISVFVKNYISNYFKRVCNEFDFGLMLLIDKSLFSLDRDVLYVSLYFPPENSPFYTGIAMSGLQQLEQLIIKNNLLDSELLLCGDFNARTSNLCDYTTCSDNIPELKEFNDIFDNDIGIERVSLDKKTNKFGHELLDFCKVFSCYIVNGRFGSGGDGYTFINQNGCSIIDYFIVSRNIYDLITMFEIQANTESSHLPISLGVKTVPCVSKKNNSKNEDLFYDLHKDNSEEYLNCLSENILNGCFTTLDTMLGDQNTDINTVVQEFETAIYNSSVKYQRVKRKKPRSNNNWFDLECKKAKQATRRLLRRFRLQRSDQNLNSYIESKCKYKNVCRQKRLLFNRKYINTVESSVNNSRKFWYEIKKVLNKPKPEAYISLDKWYEHFSSLFSSRNTEENINENFEGSFGVNMNFDEIEHLIFNSDITDEEILQGINSLNINKAHGGNIIPQHLIYGVNVLLPYIRKLFQRLFTRGEFPAKWAKSVIIPLHKKGSYNNPNNYRGIALLDVFSKVYISIITKRITFYVEAYSRLSETQAGFRAGYTTFDNAFVLYSIVNKYLSMKGKTVYVAFIDFQKAFDSVERGLLYDVLKRNGIKGHLFEAVQQIYSSVKACVRSNQGVSNVFTCPIGLRQGCSLSPVLFAMFINELYSTLCDNNIRGIQLFPDIVEIFILMFADDIALIADTVVGLQKQLNILYQFCSKSKLVVNITKTKILVFKRGGQLARREKWTYNGSQLDIVNGFTYVGIYFSNRLSMYKMAEAMSIKAKKVLICILNSFQHVPCLPFNTFFKIFDSKIASVMLYGSELWGLKKPHCIESLQIYACKRFLNVNKTACNDAILGDTGRFPMSVYSSKRCIKYWVRLLNLPRHRYPRLCYEMLMYYDNLGYNNWVSDVRDNLYSNGFGYIWEAQNVINPKMFLLQYVQKLTDQALQDWNARCRENSKLCHYINFKQCFKVEKYINAIDVDKFRRCFANFRSSAHNLMIEKGRHFNITREDRVCIYCETVIEDEYHFMIICPLYSNLRSMYLPVYYFQYPSVEKFYDLMSTENVSLLRNLSMYIYNSFKEREQLMKIYS